MARNLIIGAGQIGTALKTVFEQEHPTYLRDLENVPMQGIEILHIAFPYSPEFITQVLGYVEQYAPKLTIIHSTVPTGTTEKCGPHVVHSPVRGRHPNLVYEMPLYPKFIGGVDLFDVDRAAQFFEACQWRVVTCTSPRVTEMLKLISNVHMGLEIAWRQETQRFFEELAEKESWEEFYTLWEDSYYEGYKRLGQHQLYRPRMAAQSIGGHCILQCVEMLRGEFDSTALDFITESNYRTKQEEALMQDKMNYPKDSKKPAYPKGSQFPTTDNFDNNLTPQVGDTTGKAPPASEVPVGSQEQTALEPKHQRGVEQDTHRGQTPNETASTLSPRGSYAQSDLTQAKVMEKNDPTHDGKSFKNRSWEDKNFENRRMLY